MAIGQTQKGLAEALGISFQQVQKYELGANRVSASMLFRAAQSQGVQPAFYFSGLDEPELKGVDAASEQARDWLTSREAWSFAQYIPALPLEGRTALLQFVRDLAGKGK